VVGSQIFDYWDDSEVHALRIEKTHWCKGSIRPGILLSIMSMVTW